MLGIFGVTIAVKVEIMLESERGIEVALGFFNSLVIAPDLHLRIAEQALNVLLIVGRALIDGSLNNGKRVLAADFVDLGHYSFSGFLDFSRAFYPLDRFLFCEREEE